MFTNCLNINVAIQGVISNCRFLSLIITYFVLNPAVPYSIRDLVFLVKLSLMETFKIFSLLPSILSRFEFRL